MWSVTTVLRVAGAKQASGSGEVCWILGLLCGLLLATDVPAKLAWLDATGDVFDAVVAGAPPPPQQQHHYQQLQQPHVRASSTRHSGVAR